MNVQQANDENLDQHLATLRGTNDTDAIIVPPKTSGESVLIVFRNEDVLSKTLTNRISGRISNIEGFPCLFSRDIKGISRKLEKIEV